MLAALQPATEAPPRRHVAAASPLVALLASGAIDARRHAAALAYRDLRVCFTEACRSARKGGAGLAMSEVAWSRLKRRHEAILEAAGFERFMLDRLLLDDEPPLRCEIERIRTALGRVALLPTL